MLFPVDFLSGSWSKGLVWGTLVNGMETNVPLPCDNAFTSEQHGFLRLAVKLLRR